MKNYLNKLEVKTLKKSTFFISSCLVFLFSEVTKAKDDKTISASCPTIQFSSWENHSFSINTDEGQISINGEKLDNNLIFQKKRLFKSNGKTVTRVSQSKFSRILFDKRESNKKTRSVNFEYSEYDEGSHNVMKSGTLRILEFRYDPKRSCPLTTIVDAQGEVIFDQDLCDDLGKLYAGFDLEEINKCSDLIKKMKKTYDSRNDIVKKTMKIDPPSVSLMENLPVRLPNPLHKLFETAVQCRQFADESSVKTESIYVPQQKASEAAR